MMSNKCDQFRNKPVVSGVGVFTEKEPRMYHKITQTRSSLYIVINELKKCNQRCSEWVSRAVTELESRPETFVFVELSST